MLAGMKAMLRHYAAEANEHYATLETTLGSFMAYAFSGDRLLCLLSHAMGNLEQAMTHFEETSPSPTKRATDPCWHGASATAPTCSWSVTTR